MNTPNLQLGTPPGQLKPRTAGFGKWALVIIALQAITIGWLAVNNPASPKGKPITVPDSVSGTDLRAIAMDLEDRSLLSPAAKAWSDYLQQAPQAEDRAEILYRIGKLYLQDEQYESAAAAFIRCEHAAGEDSELAQQLGPQLITCLRRLGHYGEVGRELSRQVELDADNLGQGSVLATLAGESLTEADLDRMIEARVDQMLSMRNVQDPQMRTALLQQFSQPQARQQLLQELLRREMFTRRARELKLDQSDDFRLARQTLEDELLAARFQDQQLSKIVPTNVDLQAYYDTHQADYEVPASIEVITVELQTDEDPEQVLKDIDSADDFRQLAKQRLSSETEPKNRMIVQGRPDAELGSTDALFDLDLNSWTTEPLTHEDRRFLALVVDKTAANVSTFEEVRQRVHNDYLQVKQQQLLQQTFEELAERYDVRIVASQPSAAAESDEAQE